MTTIQPEFDQALLDTIKALTVQVEGLKKDVDVLWSSAKTNLETLGSINRVISNLNDRVVRLQDSALTEAHYS